MDGCGGGLVGCKHNERSCLQRDSWNALTSLWRERSRGPLNTACDYLHGEKRDGKMFFREKALATRRRHKPCVHRAVPLMSRLYFNATAPRRKVGRYAPGLPLRQVALVRGVPGFWIQVKLRYKLDSKLLTQGGYDMARNATPGAQRLLMSKRVMPNSSAAHRKLLSVYCLLSSGVSTFRGNFSNEDISKMN